MNTNVVEQVGSATAAQKQKESVSRETLTLEELSQAVGKHALLQVEVDQRIASHIVAMREELRSTRAEVQSLRAEMDQLIGSLTRALDSTRGSQIRPPQTNPASSLPMAIRSR